MPTVSRLPKNSGLPRRPKIGRRSIFQQGVVAMGLYKLTVETPDYIIEVTKAGVETIHWKVDSSRAMYPSNP